MLTSFILSIVSIYISLLVRNDTAELSKFSDKPIYYSINLYPNESTKDATVHEKYINMDLTLIVDDFKIKRKNFLDVNYNAVFTKTKYYMVHNYSLQDKKYQYMRYTLDDKAEAKMRLEEDYYAAPSKMNYSLTPNKEYCYILIYTETTSEKNLDLIFFKYHGKENTFTLDTITDDKGKEKIDIEQIDEDIIICQEYFIDLWSEGDSAKKDDISFMIDVYNDLKGKIKTNEF